MSFLETYSIRLAIKYSRGLNQRISIGWSESAVSNCLMYLNNSVNKFSFDIDWKWRTELSAIRSGLCLFLSSLWKNIQEWVLFGDIKFAGWPSRRPGGQSKLYSFILFHICCDFYICLCVSVCVCACVCVCVCVRAWLIANVGIDKKDEMLMPETFE